MTKALLSDLSSWYTRLNAVRTYVGLATVSPYETIASPLKAKSVHMTTLKGQVDDTQTHYNLTGTLAWDTSPGIAVGDKIKNAQFTALLSTLSSLESVNVAGVGYTQSSNTNGTNSDGANSDGINTNGTNSNGTCSNGLRNNGTNSYVANSNGLNSNGIKGNVGTNGNGTKLNGTCSNTNKSNGIHWNGAYSQGTNSNGNNSNGTKSNGTKANGVLTNGCVETSNTRETTYTNS